MKDKTIMALGESLGRIAKLERDSEEAEHTDIGDIWDVLRFAQDTLREIAHAEFRVDGEAEEFGDPPGEPVTDFKPFVKIDKVCEECGGEVTFEGWISWSVEKQEFEVDDICDKGHHCKSCDGQTHAIDVIYRPYCIQIESACVEGEGHTYRFDTREEVKAFHDGMRKGAKLVEWEVAYSDEETE